MEIYIYASGPESEIEVLGHKTNAALLPIDTTAVVSGFVDQHPEAKRFHLVLDDRSQKVAEYCKLAHPGVSFNIMDPFEFDKAEPNLDAEDKVFRLSKVMSFEKFEALNKGCPNYIFMKGGAHLYFQNGRVIKYFEDPKVTQNRADRVQFLNSCVPNNFQHTKHFIAHDFVPGETFDENLSPEDFRKLLNFLKTKFWVRPSEANSQLQKSAEVFYKEKSFERFKLFKTNFSRFFKKEHQGLIDQINWDFIKGAMFNSFHGDLLLNNVIQGKKDIVLIDWRQDFAGQIEYGDIRYDFAKLLLNLEIDFLKIKKAQYSVDFEKAAYSLPELKPELRSELLREAQDLGINPRDVEFIKILILMNIAPLHREDLAMAFWFEGIKQLKSWA